MLELIGRGEWIRTSDLTVPNDRRGKHVSICLFESCSHQGISKVLHLVSFLTIRYRLSAENFVHKLATTKWAKVFFLSRNVRYQALPEAGNEVRRVLGRRL